MDRATAFLLADQNADGSWGSHRNAGLPHGDFWTNPHTHDTWIYATTGLCCMAAQQLKHNAEADRAFRAGVEFLIENHVVKRPAGWDVDNTWAYIYGLKAVARAHADQRFDDDVRRKLSATADSLMAQLASYQTPSGGWGYYAFDGYQQRPAWATSFMTASGVLALLDARDAGLAVDQTVVERAVKAIERCRLPSGAYTYSVSAIPSPRHSEWIDQIKGSLCRIQVCNLALLRTGREVSEDQLRTGLDQFFAHHRFLDIARKKPIPHETYYLNSGYFYFYGHFYAADVIASLPESDQRAYYPKLQAEILKTQEKDGSMWDYYLNSFHKPYGTAYGLMTLTRSFQPDAATP
jgi:hypothetical protein